MAAVADVLKADAVVATAADGTKLTVRDCQVADDGSAVLKVEVERPAAGGGLGIGNVVVGRQFQVGGALPGNIARALNAFNRGDAGSNDACGGARPASRRGICGDAQPGEHFLTARCEYDVALRVEFHIADHHGPPFGPAVDGYEPALRRRVERRLTRIGHVAD